MRKSWAFLLLVLVAACSGRRSSTAADVHAAVDALLPLVSLTQTNRLAPETIRPPDALGIYAASALAMRTALPVTAAVAGVEAQLSLLPLAPEQERVFAVLAELGSTLEVVIPDYLNRSTDRAADLDTYQETLVRLLTEAEGQLTLLKEREESLKDEEKAKRDAARDLERALRDAERAQDYGTMGTTQEQLTAAQTELAGVQTEREQTHRTAALYEDLLAIGNERRIAIERNREILVAGLKVIDVPGIEDLNIVEGRTKRRRRNLGVF